MIRRAPAAPSDKLNNLANSATMAVMCDAEGMSAGMRNTSHAELSSNSAKLCEEAVPIVRLAVRTPTMPDTTPIMADCEIPEQKHLLRDGNPRAVRAQPEHYCTKHPTSTAPHT